MFYSVHLSDSNLQLNWFSNLSFEDTHKFDSSELLSRVQLHINKVLHEKNAMLKEPGHVLWALTLIKFYDDAILRAFEMFFWRLNDIFNIIDSWQNAVMVIRACDPFEVSLLSFLCLIKIFQHPKPSGLAKPYQMLTKKWNFISRFLSKSDKGNDPKSGHVFNIFESHRPLVVP